MLTFEQIQKFKENIGNTILCYKCNKNEICNIWVYIGNITGEESVQYFRCSEKKCQPLDTGIYKKYMLTDRERFVLKIC